MNLSTASFNCHLLDCNISTTYDLLCGVTCFFFADVSADLKIVNRKAVSILGEAVCATFHAVLILARQPTKVSTHFPGFVLYRNIASADRGGNLKKMMYETLWSI